MIPTPIHCPKCNAALLDGVFNQPDLTPCPACATPLQIEIFPALFRSFTPGRDGEALVVETESSCFYHPQKRAVLPCDSCGRFLCTLCDCELDGQHLCPACLESGKRKQTIKSLDDVRVLYGRQAVILGILPFFVSGLAAIYLAIRYWKAPRSLVSPSRWAMPIALVLGSLQTLAYSYLIIRAFTG